MMHLPLAEINSYDPSFKVVSRLSEEIWISCHSEGDVSLEIFSLCCRLECLIQKYRENGECTHAIASKYQPHVLLEFCKLNEKLKMLPSPCPTIEMYLYSKDYLAYFPHLVSHLSLPKIKTKNTDILKDYFNRLSSLNQLKIMCEQITNDLNNLVNHKYLAHQTALLYHAVADLGYPLQHYKDEVENLFPQIKDEIKLHGEDGQIPHLSPKLKVKLEMITGGLIDLTTQFHPELCGPLNNVTKIFAH